MLRSSAEQYRRQQRLIALVVASGRRAWLNLDPAVLSATDAYKRALLPVLIGAQRNAAEAGSNYVERALTEQDIDVEPMAQVVPSALAGTASDGRPLNTLLDEPVIRVKERIGQGFGGTEALAAGLSRLTMILRTEVADAGRVASGLQIAVRPTVGYARMLNPPSCGRCAILAGKFYRFNQGFPRHPSCDCIHIPSRESSAGDLTTSPKDYFGSLDAREQDRLFGKANAQAIRDGADPAHVINATGRKGAAYTTADGRKATLERTGRTRTARRGGRGSWVRLTPEEIYRVAPSRREAVDFLRLHGYIT